MAYYLGIDVGTSGTKTLVMDPRGRVLATGSGEHGISAPRPGWSEQDPTDFLEGTPEVKLVVGLPVEVMADREGGTETLRAMRSWMVGDHRFCVNSRTVALRVSEVQAMAQPAGTVFAFCLDSRGAWARDKRDLKAPIAVCDMSAVDVFRPGHFPAGGRLERKNLDKTILDGCEEAGVERARKHRRRGGAFRRAGTGDFHLFPAAIRSPELGQGAGPGGHAVYVVRHALGQLIEANDAVRFLQLRSPRSLRVVLWRPYRRFVSVE